MVSAAIFRGQAQHLTERGWLDAVLAQVGGEAKELLSHPPLPIVRVHANLSDEVLKAVGETYGLPACLETAYQAVKRGPGPLVSPIIESLLRAASPTPHALFDNLSTICRWVTVNVRFAYAELGAQAGRVTLSHDERANRWWFLSWQAAFRYGYDVSGVTGEVSSPEIDAQGTSATYAVSW
jgi:hypothetical protein